MLRRPSAGRLDCMPVNASAGSSRVLVVDDDEPLARVMARTLRGRGFDCDVALSGAAARKLLKAQDYVLAVANIRRRSLEIKQRESVDRLEDVVARRAEQMRKAAELQSGMLPASPLKEGGFEI